MFAALGGTGLVAYELTRRRRAGESSTVDTVEREAAARREAEEQLAFVINTSPAAILTMTDTGDIVRGERRGASAVRRRATAILSGCRIAPIHPRARTRAGRQQRHADISRPKCVAAASAKTASAFPGRRLLFDVQHRARTAAGGDGRRHLRGSWSNARNRISSSSWRVRACSYRP